MTSQIGYLKLLITRSILSGPLDFEIKRVACICFGVSEVLKLMDINCTISIRCGQTKPSVFYTLLYGYYFYYYTVYLMSLKHAR